MFVKINDIDVNATLISTFYKSESEPYQITYYMLSGPTLVEEFSNASDMNDKYELVSELSIGSGGGGSANVYTYKGSCLFANLPVSDNVVGDVWNIEDDFTLDGKNYPAGTNVAWDGTDWDVLAGNSGPNLTRVISVSDINNFHSYRFDTISTTSNDLLINACNDVIRSGATAFTLIVNNASDSEWYSQYVYSVRIRLSDANHVLTMTCVSSMDSWGDRPGIYQGQYKIPTQFYFSGTLENGLIKTLSRYSEGGGGNQRALGIGNTEEYTPTANYHPATKKYVDDSLLNIAPLYDVTATYDLGDLVIYNALLYKCTTAIAVAEAWDSTHWTRTTVFEVLGSVNTALSALTTPGNGGGN